MMADASAAKDLRNPQMKQLYARVLEQKSELGWSDARLCEFATQTLLPLDPYKRFKVTSVDFLSRLRPGLLKALVGALDKAPR